jgi:hypothetical protein
MQAAHITRALHHDHAATLALLRRIDALLGHNGPASPPARAAPGLAFLLRDIAAAVAAEIGPHFAFEEHALFPLLGDGDALADALIAEHAALLPAAADLATRARAAGQGGFDGPGWAGFHAAAAAHSAALAAHVEKEELGLLPALDALLDAEADGRLAMDYAAQR